MRALRDLLLCLLLAVLCALAGGILAAAWAAKATVEALPYQIAATRAALVSELQATRRDALATLDRQATGIRQDADRRIGDTLSRVDAALLEMRGARVDAEQSLRRVDGLLLDGSSLITDLRASVSQVNDALPLFLDCDHNPDCAFNRYVGASKGIERAALNVGQMSGDVRAKLPAALATWQRIGANSDRLTDATATTMQNFARATAPLPKWLRIPLSITGAVAPTVSGAIGAAAAVGAFR